MKSVKLIVFSFICSIVILPIITKADSIINNNGIVMTEEEYNNFLNIYSHDYIMVMTEEKYNRIKDLDYSDITAENQYIETTYNSSLNLTTHRELTKEEYDNYDVNQNSRLADGAISRESTAKHLNLTVLGGTTYNYVVVTATWKYIPTVRSYDVIGIRGYGLNFRNGSQTGQQIYTLNGNYTVIDYAWNGTNIKKFDNGFGISMNIVNTDITALQLMVECDVSEAQSYPAVYGSYQHAVSEVSLANSQNYTLDGAGLGDVFVFPYSVSQKYDGMAGLHIQY